MIVEYVKKEDWAILPERPKDQENRYSVDLINPTAVLIFPDRVNFISLGFQIKLPDTYCFKVNHLHVLNKPWRLIHDYLDIVGLDSDTVILPVITSKEVMVAKGEVLAHIELASVKNIIKKKIGKIYSFFTVGCLLFYDLTCCFFVADAELKFSMLDVFNKPFGVTMA